MILTGKQQTRHTQSPQILTTLLTKVPQIQLISTCNINYSIREEQLKSPKELMGWLWTSIIRELQNEAFHGTCSSPRAVLSSKLTHRHCKEPLANWGWKQNKELGFLLEIRGFQPRFYQRSTAPNHTTTQTLDWLNFQFLFQQQNWNHLHLYSVRTLHGYFQPLKVNALIEGNWKLFSQTHNIQLHKTQNTVRDHRFNRGGSTQRHAENEEIKWSHCTFPQNYPQGAY